jgi:hypothetical protein
MKSAEEPDGEAQASKSFMNKSLSVTRKKVQNNKVSQQDFILFEQNHSNTCNKEN